MNWKKPICTGLSLALAAGALTGCGGKEQEAPHPEFMYVAEYIPVKGEFSGTLGNAIFANGALYAQGQTRTWVEYDSLGEDPGVIAYGIDEEAPEAEEEPGDTGTGSAALIAPAPAEEPAEEEPAEEDDSPETDPDLPEGEMPEDWEMPTGYWSYQTALFKIGLDGSCEQIPYELPPEENLENGYSSTNINGMGVTTEGDIYILENTWRSWQDEPPEGVTWETDPMFYEHYYHDEQSYKLNKIDDSGKVLGSITLDEIKNQMLENEGYFSINTFAVDAEGNVYLGTEQSVFILDSQGKLRARLGMEGDGYIESLVRLPSGSVACIRSTWTDTGSSRNLYELTPDMTELGEGTPLAGYFEMTPGGGDYDFYYTSGINFFGYKMETGESEKLLNWISSDVDPSYANGAVVLDDGRVAVLSSRYVNNGGRGGRYGYVVDGYDDSESYETQLILLTKTPYDQVPQREILTLATQSLGWDMRGQIIEFNQTNDKYRIEVQDYSEYNTADDYEAGLTKLRTEIMSGTVPDILDLNGFAVGQLATRGMLEDLYPYIDKDEKLGGREALMTQVLDACAIDGKLYQTVDGFTIMTAMGGKDVVGDTPGWTVEQFQAALKKLQEKNPQATAMNQYITREEILQICLYLDMDRFVDWSTGTCSFDSDGFKGLLAFANSFPTEFDWENYEWSEEDDEYYRIGNGLQMLAPMSVSGFEVYEMRIYNKLFGGEGVFIGFPTEYGVGNMLQVNSQFAMTSKCRDKDAAWEFLRTFFTEDYQMNKSWSLPTNRAAFDTLARQAMEPQYQMDANGNYILDKNGNRQEVEYGTWGWGEYEVPGGPLTQKELDQITALVESTDKVLNYDQDIYNIVSENTAPYFEGQRSADDVAAQIQSKATLYVNEQR